MKKFVLVIFLVLCIWASGVSAVFAGERIDAYQVYIIINPDSSIEVLESIDYNFGAGVKKGIFRTIPIIVREEGVSYRLGISEIEAFDDQGNNQLFGIKEGRKELRVDLGSDVPEFTGVYRFHLKYKVEGVLKHEEEYDALHWNAIGLEWQIPIEGASLTVELPKAVSVELIKSECFAGSSGSKNPCSKSEFEYIDIEGGEDLSIERGEVIRILYLHSGLLGGGRGMTVDLKLPKGVVEEGEREEVPSVPKIIIILSFIGWLLPAYFLIKLINRSSDPGPKKKIFRRYDLPTGVTLSSAGVVINRQFGNDGLVAELLSLAIKGYIKIVSGKRKFLFFKTSAFLFLKLKPEESLPRTERAIMRRVFKARFAITKQDALEYFAEEITGFEDDVQSALAVTSSEQLERHRSHFRAYFKEISIKAKEEAFEAGFFEEGFKDSISAAIKGYLLRISFAISVLIGTAFAALYYYQSISLDVVLVLVFLTLFFSFFLILLGLTIIPNRLPRRTKEGVETRDHLLGLRKYIKVAEKERMDFHFDPKKNPEIFEKLLPYAVVLGLQKSWISHLSELEYDPPWYRSSTPGSLSVSGLNGMVSSLSSTSSSGSGGGGGAGGGAGGGGGGSR